MLSLPEDILVEIIAQPLLSQADRFSLCLVNRTINCLTRPFLYRADVQFDNSSALIWACQNGRLDTARIAMENGADMNARSEHHPRSQPLNVAVENNHAEVVKFLLAEGANVNGRDLANGGTSLLEAVHSGFADIVDILLDHEDILINLRNKHGYAPLDVVFSDETSTTTSSRIMKKFLQRPDIDVNCRGLHGRTPLHWASAYGKVEAVELLLRHAQIQPDILDDYGYSPFHYACQSANAQIAKKLLQREDVDINRSIAIRRNITPFLMSVKFENTGFFNFMFSKRDRLNTSATTVDGENAIMLASKRRNSKILQKLLGAVDIDINARCRYGKTAFSYAVVAAADRMSGIRDNADSEEQKRELPTFVRGPKGILSLLLQHGADPSIPDNEGVTALHRSIMRGHLALAKMILEDSRVDPSHPDDSGSTPLHFAAWKPPPGMLEFFLKFKDIDINCTNNRGLTPLAEATDAADLRAMQLLLEDPRIIIDHKGVNGKTPTEIANDSGRLSTTRFLRDWRKKMQPEPTKAVPKSKRR